MNRKLRCSKRQAKKLLGKFSNSPVSILRNHRLTARETLFIQGMVRKIRRDISDRLGVPRRFMTVDDIVSTCATELRLRR